MKEGVEQHQRAAVMGGGCHLSTPTAGIMYFISAAAVSAGRPELWSPRGWRNRDLHAELLTASGLGQAGKPRAEKWIRPERYHIVPAN